MFNTTNAQRAENVGSGSILDTVIGIGGQVGEIWLKSREQDVVISENKKQTAMATSSAVAEATAALNTQNMVNVVKWSAVAVLGLVLGSQLIRMVNKRVRGA